MKRLVAAAVLIVAVGELVAFAVLDRELVLMVVGVMLAAVLLVLRLHLVRDPDRDAGGGSRDEPGESLRRWLTRSPSRTWWCPTSWPSPATTLP